VASHRSRKPVFVIENKVEAKLTLKQLRKYRRHGVRYLVAITKYPPDVPERHMRREGVFALRWQDVHRHLSSRLPRTPVDRFLTKSFIQYLEDLEMAYPERLKARELQNIRRMLNVAASQKRYKGLDPKEAFATADHCLQVLTELRRQLVEKIPELEEFGFWGPKFYVWRDQQDADERKGFHAFGWEIRGKPWWVVSFSCNLYFPKSLREPIRWGVSLYGRHRPEKERAFTLAQISAADGTLRQDLMLRTLVEVARQWRVPKVIKRSRRHH
jgi:hypothetical protein